MHPNALLIERLYERFGALDAEGVAACYHPDAVFSDPVFPELRGPRVAAMWRMLVAHARELRVTCRDVRADDATGSARWEAEYSFAKARRRVRNVIDARFEFRDGLVARHVDSFDLWRWSRMALGAPGTLLGWTPLLERRLRSEAAKALAEFERAHAPPPRAPNG